MCLILFSFFHLKNSSGQNMLYIRSENNPLNADRIFSCFSVYKFLHISSFRKKKNLLLNQNDTPKSKTQKYEWFLTTRCQEIQADIIDRLSIRIWGRLELMYIKISIVYQPLVQKKQKNLSDLNLHLFFV